MLYLNFLTQQNWRHQKETKLDIFKENKTGYSLQKQNWLLLRETKLEIP